LDLSIDIGTNELGEIEAVSSEVLDIIKKTYPPNEKKKKENSINKMSSYKNDLLTTIQLQYKKEEMKMI